MFRVGLTPERINNAHSFLTYTPAVPWYNESEGWKTGEKSLTEKIHGQINTSPVGLPFPLDSAYFEVIRTGNRYALAMNVSFDTPKAIENITKPPRELFDNNCPPFFIPTSYYGTGYFLETRASNVCFGAITLFEGLMEISLGAGGARNFLYKNERNFKKNVAQLTDITNRFIEAVRKNYERQLNMPFQFPELNIQIS